jgi:protoporphyrinogen oxidase
MSPPGQTSLAIELPCNADDATWRADDASVVAQVTPALSRIGWIEPRTVIGYTVARIPHAYPVLTSEAERAAAAIVDHLTVFKNFHLAGRNGLFYYGWLHTVMRMADDVVRRLE